MYRLQSIRSNGIRNAVLSAINACLVLASLISASIAQETPKAETTKAPPNVSTRKPDATPPQLNDDALPDPAMLSDVNSDIVYIPGADGRYIKILVSTKLNEFLNWLKTNGGTNVETQPAFGITSLKISGSANDEHASLKIIVTLQLTVDEPVRVPLNLREAVIQNVTYRGEGREAIPDRFAEGAAARQAGYVWWFQGKGTHELELDVLVPVVTQSPTRRMQLTLPNTAVGSMVLAVPFDRFQVKLPEDSTSLVKTNFRDETNASRIELVGLDSRLDISWQPAPETQPVDLVLQSAFSPIDLDFTGETVLLSATQKVGALQGTFDNFTVTLPPDFKPLDVEGPSYRKREFVENDESRVTISLKEPTKGPIEIKWTLEAPFPSKGIPFAVEGFQVEHAQRQTGEIQIRSPDGYRIHRREGEDRFIHRINVSDSGVVDRVSSAYRFLKQPFRLVLDVQKEEPYYSVTPELLAHVTEGHIDLMCRFRFQVFRGAVSNVVIRWPLAVNEGWAIDPVQTPGLIESVTMTEEETGDGASSESRWQLKFVAPKSGDFEITLNARRPIQSDGSRLPCHLPMAEASSSAPTILAWILAENVESDLKPIGTTTLRPVPTTLAARVNVPAEWMSLRQFLWRIDSAEQVLEAGVKKYAQRIEAESDIEATIGEKEIKVRQRLDYDVSYERVSVLRMTVSSDLVPRPKFYLDEKPISTVWNEEGNTTVVSARLELPEPRLKHFEVVAEYSVPIPLTTEDEEKAEIQLPIVQSSDAAFKSTRILFQQQSLWEVDVSDQGWQSEVATEDALVYRSTKPQAYVPLTIREYLGERQRTLTISRAVIRTQFVPDGQTMTRAQYRIQGSGREIGIALPMELELVNAYINQNTIVLDGTEVTAEQTINYRIPLTGNIDLSKSGSVILTMDIRSKSVANFDWLDRQKIVLPEVVDELLIQQTIFEVILPGGQHLADNPNGLLPQFSWQLTLHGGMRRPLRDWSNPDDWIGSTNDVPPPLDGFDAGNGYVFSRFGAIESVTIHTLHRSLLVLFGAGLSLLASAVWLNVARVRHPYSMVVMVLIASLVGIWHESIVILLLQPFFGGLLLAFLAFAIDRRYRRETAPAVVTLGSTNEYMVPISSAFRSIPDQPSASAIKSIDRQVGSEDPTTLRPAHSGSPRDSVSVAE